MGESFYKVHPTCFRSIQFLHILLDLDVILGVFRMDGQIWRTVGEKSGSFDRWNWYWSQTSGKGKVKVTAEKPFKCYQCHTVKVDFSAKTSNKKKLKEKSAREL